MHVMQYAVIEDTEEARQNLLSNIDSEVMMEGDWGSGYDYGLANPENWLRDGIYENREAAQKALKRYEGDYDDHAVLFHNTDEAKETTAMRRIKKAIERKRTAMRKFDLANDVRNRKSKTITCPQCESRITLSYLRSGRECPVCFGDMRSKSVLERLARMKDEIGSLEDKLRAERDKQGDECPVRWLCKYEYHC